MTAPLAGRQHLHEMVSRLLAGFLAGPYPLRRTGKLSGIAGDRPCPALSSDRARR